MLLRMDPPRDCPPADVLLLGAQVVDADGACSEGVNVDLWGCSSWLCCRGGASTGNPPKPEPVAVDEGTCKAIGY